MKDCKLISLFVLLIVPVSARVEIALYKHTTSLDMRVKESLKLTFINLGNATIDTVRIRVPIRSWGWRVYDEKGNPLKFYPGIDQMNITFREPLGPNELRTIECFYFSEGIVRNIGGVSKFSYTLSTFYPAKNVYFTVKLPPGKYVLEKDLIDPITPEKYSTGSDGRSILIHWYIPELKTEQKFTIWFEVSGVTKLYTIIGIGILAIILVLMLVVFAFRKFLRPKKVISLSLLKEDERKVLEAIMEGEITQKELRKKLGFSKAKLSRVIRDLEERGIIEKRPYHRTNIISLKKELR